MNAVAVFLMAQERDHLYQPLDILCSNIFVMRFIVVAFLLGTTAMLLLFPSADILGKSR